MMATAEAPAGAASGARRAATLLMLLGDEAAAQVLGHLSDTEVEAIGLELAKLDRVDPGEAREAVADYLAAVPAEGGALGGGRERLEKLLAARGAGGERILKRITRCVEGARPVDVAEVDPASLAGILEVEPPQAVAVLLARMEAKAAGRLLEKLSPEARGAVALRLARLERVDPETLEHLLATLRLRLQSLGQVAGSEPDGVRSLAAILNHVSSTVMSEVIEGLEMENQELASKVKDQTVVFEDFLLLDHRAMAVVVQRVDKKLLAVALKGTTEEVRDRFFSGMSARAGENLREEMQFLGPVRVAEVQKAQAGVLTVLKKLMEEGAVALNRGGEGLVA